MVQATVALMIASLTLLTCGESIRRSMVVLESRETAPIGFIHNGQPADDTILELRIALTQNDMAALEQELYAVSTPGSNRYGQHLTKEEVEQYVKPSSETLDLVDEWLGQNNISYETISPAGDWIQISVSVSEANTLLDTEFNTFANQASSQQAIRTLSYSIPSNLNGHIDFIHPTIAFPAASRSGAPILSSISPQLSPRSFDPAPTDTVPASCNSTVTPACLQAIYGIPTTLATQSSNILAVSGFFAQFANEQDLELFLTTFRPDLSPNTTFTLQTIDGGLNSQDPDEAGSEADIDTQYTIGIASGVPVTFISSGVKTTDDLDGFLDVINTLLNETDTPNVLTTSYSIPEGDTTSILANRFCNACMQLGARGTSLLYSSGDGGVGGAAQTDCIDFSPSFPSSCPYVTSVGATAGINETTAPFSGGGFSDYFTPPSYQASAVSSYLSMLGTTYSGLYNSSGRGFPDVSAQGYNVSFVWKGKTILTYGTSFSAPIFASIVALLNDELITAGKSPLGFLNPFLYSQNGIDALNDITTGNNPGCDTNGFSASIGWDPATGLGTPNYQKLRQALGLDSC